MRVQNKHYLISGILIVLTVLVSYVFPFVLGNKIEGNDIAWEQYLITLLLLLPAFALYLKKPKSLWVYSYPVITFLVMLLAFLAEDALATGLLIMFLGLPFAIVYTILVVIKIIK